MYTCYIAVEILKIDVTFSVPVLAYLHQNYTVTLNSHIY